MKTILFDLKGTLVDEAFVIRPGVQEFLQEMFERKNVQVVIYSMNEAWTYAAFSANPLLARVEKVILVRKKCLTDMKQIQDTASNVLVVGDGVNEELLFAKEVGLKSYDATNSFPATAIMRWTENNDG